MKHLNKKKTKILLNQENITVTIYINLQFHTNVSSVRQSYPDEAGHVDQREKEIMDMWKALQDRMKERKKQLGDREEEMKFAEEAKDLVRKRVWC